MFPSELCYNELRALCKLFLNLIVKELLDIKEDNADNRRTEILSENAEVVIDTSDFEVIEDCVVVLTRSGVIKKMSVKAFKKGMETGSKDEANAPLTVLATKSNRLIRCFTDAGNMYSINAMDIPESRWREKGRAINTLLLGVLKSESIIGIYDFSDYKDSDTIVFVTNTGMIKRSNLGEYKTKNSK